MINSSIVVLFNWQIREGLHKIWFAYRKQLNKNKWSLKTIRVVRFPSLSLLGTRDSNCNSWLFHAPNNLAKYTEIDPLAEGPVYPLGETNVIKSMNEP